MSLDLARRKQDKLTGGNVNYYLQVLGDKTTVVECEDVIESADMSFAGGTVFKSIWRLCKLRMDLGKPGSTGVYESGKGSYYTDRTLAVSKRRLNNLTGITKIIRDIVHWFHHESFDSSYRMTIADPKRLSPYSFIISDLLEALEATPEEAEVLSKILKISLMRQSSWFPFKDEIDVAEIACIYAKRVEAYETLRKQKMTESMSNVS